MSLFKRLKARLDPILLTDADFVDSAFREILGRDADQGGLEFYCGILRQGVRRNAVFLDIMRSEEFKRTLAPAAHSSLPNLVVLRPERYRRTVDRSTGQSILVYEAASPADADWLEDAIITHGYYEKPGVWVLDVDFDKRLVAEMLAAFAPGAGLELGCAAGAVLECLQDLGIEADGIDISAMARERASDRVRPRIHQGDILSVTLPTKYDLLFGLDVFEHLNPNKLEAYLACATSRSSVRSTRSTTGTCEHAGLRGERSSCSASRPRPPAAAGSSPGSASLRQFSDSSRGSHT